MGRGGIGWRVEGGQGGLGQGEVGSRKKGRRDARLNETKKKRRGRVWIWIGYGGQETCGAGWGGVGWGGFGMGWSCLDGIWDGVVVCGCD